MFNLCFYAYFLDVSVLICASSYKWNIMIFIRSDGTSINTSIEMFQIPQPTHLLKVVSAT